MFRKSVIIIITCLFCTVTQAQETFIESADQSLQMLRNTKLGKAEIKARDLCLETALVVAGRPAAAIVIPYRPFYRELAARVNAKIKACSGVELPVIADETLRDMRLLERNYILIGNRDRNIAVANLYNLHFTLLDAKYPGPGGNELRSMHNPFGDKHNLIFAGGSLEDDDAAAVEKLLCAIERSARSSELKLGFLAEVTLSPEYAGKIARDVNEILLWERSAGYGDKAYFGWNSLSKNLAMLYITNDKYYAEEFLRLAFPQDSVTIDELRHRDDESYKDEIADPIKSVYHYRGILMILYWAMVEANPHFTDADREKVNQAFYRQLVYALTKDDYTNPYIRYDKPGFYSADRHLTWEVVGVYATARFFQAHYPCFDSTEALRLTDNAMRGIFERFISGTISRFWHQTQLEPIFFYATLAGGLDYIGHPMLREYGKSLLLMSDLSSLKSHSSDRMMYYSTPFLLNQFGYFCQDNAFTELARRLPAPTDVFRLGQSFYPVASYPHDFFTETAGKWTEYRYDPRHLSVKPSFPPEQVVQAMSFREKADGSGDYLLMDTRYAPGLREAPHTFSILNYLHQGVPVLRGHENTLRFYADGANSDEICYYSQLGAYGRIGDYVYVTAKMDRIDGFAWERTLIMKIGEYLLLIDEVAPLRDMRLGEIYNDLRPIHERAVMKMTPFGDLTVEMSQEYTGRNYLISQSLPAELRFDKLRLDTQYGHTTMARFCLNYTDLKQGEAIRFATLVRPGQSDNHSATAQSGKRIALLLPEPALLELDREKLTLTTGVDRLIRLGDIWKLEAGHVDAEEVRQLIAARSKYVEPEKVQFEAPEAVWSLELGGPVHLLKLFSVDQKEYFTASTGSTLFVGNADGQILWRHDLPAEIGVIEFQPSKRRLLVGCKDEKLIAFDLAGQNVWEFTSVMAPEMMTYGPYHHKSAHPGVMALLISDFTGVEHIYVGSVGTIEILDEDGKLQQRVHPTYYRMDNLVLQPTDGQEPGQLLLVGSNPGHPNLFALNADEKPVDLQLNADHVGTFMGSFGFGSVGRTHLFPVRLTPGGPLELLGTFAGAQNRVVIWNRTGKALRGINLGPDQPASSTLPYGSSTSELRHFQGLAALDLDGDGKLEITAVTRRKRLFIWDSELKERAIIILPEIPQLMVGAPTDGKVVIGFTDGLILASAADGKLIPVGKLPTRIVSLQIVGKTVFTGDEKGTLARFEL